MGERYRWGGIFKQLSRRALNWRQEHRQATLTEIEDVVDRELAELRAQMIEDMAMASVAADWRSLPEEEKPSCPQCGRPLSANGQGRRELTTDWEQRVELKRSKGYCHHCQVSFFPPG